MINMRIFGLLILMVFMSITGSSQTPLLEKEEFADLRVAIEKFETTILARKAAERDQVRAVNAVLIAKRAVQIVEEDKARADLALKSALLSECFGLEGDAVSAIKDVADKVCKGNAVSIWNFSMRLADAQARVKEAKAEVEKAEEGIRKVEEEIKGYEAQGIQFNRETVFLDAKRDHFWACGGYQNGLRDVAGYKELLNGGLGDCIADCKQ